CTAASSVARTNGSTSLSIIVPFPLLPCSPRPDSGVRTDDADHEAPGSGRNRGQKLPDRCPHGSGGRGANSYCLWGDPSTPSRWRSRCAVTKGLRELPRLAAEEVSSRAVVVRTPGRSSTTVAESFDG